MAHLEWLEALEAREIFFGYDTCVGAYGSPKMKGLIVFFWPCLPQGN